MRMRRASLLTALTIVLVLMSSTGCMPSNVSITWACNAVQVAYMAGGDGGGGGQLGFTVYRNDTNEQLGSGNGDAIPDGSMQVVFISFSSEQSPGTFLRLELSYYDGTTPAIKTYTGSCNGKVEGPHFWDPGDHRIAPLAGDRLAVWCDQPDTVSVFGVDDKSRGFLLAHFSYKALLAAGPTGIDQTVGVYGTVSASTDGKNNFWIAWTGPHADGQPDHGYAKGFTCPFETDGTMKK